MQELLSALRLLENQLFWTQLAKSDLDLTNSLKDNTI